MAGIGHLWAIGYSETGRAAEVRDVANRLAERHDLVLLDIAVLVCGSDGTATLDGEPFLPPTNFRSHSVARFFASLALGAPPLTGAAIEAYSRDGGIAAAAGIHSDFIRDVQRMIKPGTSALFVSEQAGDMEALLQAIRGLGGTVLKTNVDLAQATRIQSTLSATAAEISRPEGQ
jgi:uncharacterized membrane protein